MKFVFTRKDVFWARHHDVFPVLKKLDIQRQTATIIDKNNQKIILRFPKYITKGLSDIQLTLYETFIDYKLC